MQIEINDAELDRALMALQNALSDMTPVTQEMGEILVRTTKERFKDGVSPDGTRWAPKSKTTIKAYQKRGDKVDFRPLFGPSGALSSQIHYQADATSVEWGSSLIYAAVQQFGARKGAFGSYQGKGFGDTTPTISIPWGNIPARPFIGLSDEDQSMLVETVEEWLQDAADD